MFNFLKPTYYFHTVFDIPDTFWSEQGIKGILFDIDNTLEPYATEVPSQRTLKLFEKLSELGISTAIISNNHKERVEKFASPLNAEYYYESLKPRTGNIFSAINNMGLKKDNVVIIGDQLFTDIWAGSRAEIRSIFVDKLSDDESTFIKAKRALEVPFVKRIKKNGYGKYEKSC